MNDRPAQLTPSDHCYVILQDHGPDDGGWGPAAIVTPDGIGFAAVVYTGSDEQTIKALKEIALRLAQAGKATRLVRYSVREDVVVYGGSS